MGDHDTRQRFLFEPEPVGFRCHCFRERINHTLRLQGKQEVQGNRSDPLP